ncbi:MAG: hypothetical protein IPJ71_15545 [Bdellovibrionales bacterium]|nr:hypothetical protein [Bdellovibrionales bacterium]
MIEFLIAIFLGCISSFAAVEEPPYDELTGLDLVEVLIRDDRLDLAQQELEGKPQSSRYWMLRGHLEMARKNFFQGLYSYQKSEPSEERSLFLARSSHELRKFEDCRIQYRNSGHLWKKSEEDIIARSKCEFQTNSWQEALNSLEQGELIFKSFSLKREHVALLLDLGLNQLALSLATAELGSVRSSELLSLAQLFSEKKATKESLVFIEYARAMAPNDIEIQVLSAQVAFQNGQYRTTLDSLIRSASLSPKYQFHVAELYRQMGKFEQATFHSQFIQDSKERFRSRMAIYLDQKNYSLVASMDSLMGREVGAGDDEVRYALAYALFSQGNFDRSLTYLNSIRQSSLIEKTSQLKKTLKETQASARL